MFRYPDGTFKRHLPSHIFENNTKYDTRAWSPELWDEKGYNEALPIKKDSEYEYTTEWVKEDFLYKEINSNEPVFKETELFPVYQTNKLAEIKDKADAALEPIINKYSISERLSWAEQLFEARAWAANETASTPLVDAIIAESGDTKLDAMSVILTAANSWAVTAGRVLGLRNKFHKQLEAAATCAEIEEINVAY